MRTGALTQEGNGMCNVRERLEVLYGPATDFEIAGARGGGRGDDANARDDAGLMPGNFAFKVDLTILDDFQNSLPNHPSSFALLN